MSDLMPADARFRVGQRVKMTQAAIEASIPTRWKGKVTTTGTVRGVYAQGVQILRVQLDGRKTATRYWTGFWEPARKPRASNG